MRGNFLIWGRYGLPAYYDKDEFVHTERFWSFQKQGKFCNVDVDKVVNDASWQAFITKTISGILTLNDTTWRFVKADFVCKSDTQKEERDSYCWL